MWVFTKHTTMPSIQIRFGHLHADSKLSKDTLFQLLAFERRDVPSVHLPKGRVSLRMILLFGIFVRGRWECDHLSFFGAVLVRRASVEDLPGGQILETKARPEPHEWGSRAHFPDAEGEAQRDVAAWPR